VGSEINVTYFKPATFLIVPSDGFIIIIPNKLTAMFRGIVRG